MKLLVGLLLLAALGGRGSALPPSAFEDASPEMHPESFFAGQTSSSGVLENRSGAPTRRFYVIGTGQALSDGIFRLDQRVDMGQGPPTMRTWVLRRIDAHHYAGTLTDASGDVTGEAYGNLFHLTYAMKSPFGGHMEQWLYLQPDGHTILNEATITVFGIVAAHLSERITHEGP